MAQKHSIVIRYIDKFGKIRNVSGPGSLGDALRAVEMVIKDDAEKLQIEEWEIGLTDFVDSEGRVKFNVFPAGQPGMQYPSS